MTTTDSAPRAEGVRWDLSPLATSADDCRTRLAAAIDDCRAFESRYRGRVAAFAGASYVLVLATLTVPGPVVLFAGFALVARWIL